MKPPGRDIKTVKQQLDDIGRFYKRLEGADDLVGDTERAAEMLVESGYTVDSAKTRDQVCGDTFQIFMVKATLLWISQGCFFIVQVYLYDDEDGVHKKKLK